MRAAGAGMHLVGDGAHPSRSTTYVKATCICPSGNGAPAGKENWKGKLLECLQHSFGGSTPAPTFTTPMLNTGLFRTRVTLAVPGLDTPVELEGEPHRTKKDAERAAARKAFEYVEENQDSLVPTAAVPAAAALSPGAGAGLEGEGCWGRHAPGRG